MSDLWGLLVAIGMAVGMFIFGRIKGMRNERATAAKRQAAADARMTKTAQEKTDEVGRMSDDRVDERLRERARK